MHDTKRIALFALFVAAGIVGVSRLAGVGSVTRASHAGSAAMFAETPEPTRLAVCDVYGVAEKLLQTDRFIPAREAEEKAITESIKPVADALEAIKRDVESRGGIGEGGVDPKTEEGQRIGREFQKKTEEFARLSRDGQVRFQKFVSGQFIEALGLVRDSCARVAAEKGFTHVIASRDIDKPIETVDPERLIEAMLGRPVVVRPEGADITPDVMADLRVSGE